MYFDVPWISLSVTGTVCFERGINDGERYPFQLHKFCKLV